MTTTDWTSDTKGTPGYADVNGLHLYYEVHGSGGPLVLLHGGLGSGEMFGPVIGLLANAGHQVIVPDLQGHGRTADIDRPMSLPAMGDDIAALIRLLGHERVDLVGYSLGGGVAFQVASRHPELVRRLVMASANIKRSAIYPEMLAQQGSMSAAVAAALRDTPMYHTYERLAPRPEDFPRLLDKMGAWMAQDFDFSEQVRALRVPTLFVAADADMFPVSHAAEVFALLDGGQRDGGWMGEGRPKGGHALAILPGHQHYTVGASPLFAAVALAFIDAPEG